MRAIAILLVMVSHSRVFLPAHMNSAHISLGGFLGVELFFVLSGFLVGGILIKLVDQVGSKFSFADVVEFWKRRWFRTLPNYYLILLVNLLIVSLTSGKVIWGLSYFIFFQNFVTPIQEGINYTQSWSLTVEEWFYIFLPILVLVTVRIFSERFDKKHLLMAMVISLILYPLLRYGYIFAVDSIGKASKLSFNVLRTVAIVRLDSILYGVLIAFFDFYYKKKLVANRFVLAAVGLVLFIFSMIVLYQYNLTDQTRKLGLVDTLFPGMLSLSLSCWLPYFNAIQINRPNIFTHFILLTSLISYSLYLVHFSIVIPFVEALGVNSWMQLLLFWLLSFMLSILIYVFYERKMTALRDRSDKKST